MNNNDLRKLMIEYGNLTNVKYVDNSECNSICPFCGSKGRNKFYFNRKGMYLCFLCGEKGNIVSFFNRVCNLSKKDTNKLLKTCYVNDDTSKIVTNSDLLYKVSSNISNNDESSNTNIKKMPPLPTNTVKLKDTIGYNEYRPFFNYLVRRGVTKNQLLTYDIRFCISGKVKTKSGKELAIKNSIIFVNYEDNKPAYWNTRSIENNPFLKTFNATPLDNTYHSKSDSVFNIDKVNSNSVCVICESVFNALTISDNYTNLVGVATYGKVITETQLRSIIAKNPKKIVIALDQDAVYEMYQLVTRINALGYQNVYVIDYSDTVNKLADINDLGRKKAVDLIRKSKKGNSTILQNVVSSLLT